DVPLRGQDDDVQTTVVESGIGKERDAGLQESDISHDHSPCAKAVEGSVVHTDAHMHGGKAECLEPGDKVGGVPLGTGNLLARNVGLPLNLREALDVAFAGQDSAIDLTTFDTDATEEGPAAEAGERPDPTAFMVMAGLGVDAEIMAGVDD